MTKKRIEDNLLICSVAVPRAKAKEARIIAAELDTTRSALMCNLLLDFMRDYQQKKGSKQHEPQS